VRSRFRWEGPLLVLVATVPDLSFFKTCTSRWRTCGWTNRLNNVLNRIEPSRQVVRAPLELLTVR